MGLISDLTEPRERRPAALSAAGSLDRRHVTRCADGDVEGPVRAEAFVVWLASDRLELGPAPERGEPGAAERG